MDSRLNIPKKLKVGFQKRTDTYSGKLAYVTYLDKKDKIAKHTSWERWRSKEMTVEDYDNKPTEGFVLNKRVGGYKSGWNYRQTKCRVWDPRGFEIEISLENLLYILQECTSTKGKGLEGEFVYAWSGPELILLPVDTEDYRASTTLIEKTEKISVRDLKLGSAYRGKESEYLIYIGKQEWTVWVTKEDKSIYRYSYDRNVWKERKTVKLQTFVDVEKKRFMGYKDMSYLYYVIEDNAITTDDVATYVENFKTTPPYQMQFVTELAINDTLKEWEAYLAKDDKYSYGVTLIMKTPNEKVLNVIKCRKNYFYEGLSYSIWLREKGITIYSPKEVRDAAEAEFNANAEITYSYRVTADISFNYGRLQIQYRSGGEYVTLTDDDIKNMSDGNDYKFSFITSNGEKTKYWNNECLSKCSCAFNENAPLPIE